MVNICAIGRVWPFEETMVYADLNVRHGGRVCVAELQRCASCDLLSLSTCA